MANCPKCGKKLRLYHWRPECPFCGVNMVYYKSNDRMLEETERAEIEHAHSQPRIDRAKAAFFGSPPAIARIVLSLLPIGALFLPLGRVRASDPFNAIGIYQYISDRGLFSASYGKALDLSLLLLLISVSFILVCLICLPMSLGPHGKARNLILNLIQFGSAAASAGLFAVRTGDLQIGAFVYLFLVLALLVYNLILAKKGLKIKHTVCLIGGLPSEEYFQMKEDGVSELEIRKKMVEALTVMQNEARVKEAEEEAEALRKRAEHM
jgi:hypothetical protein